MATLPAASTLPEALGGRQAALISASLSANTRRAYRRAWDAWLAWLGQEQASDVTASAYLAAMHDAGKAPATCALHAAALRFAHRVGVRGAPVPGPLMERTLAGIHREGRARGRGQVEGITWSQADATAQVAAQAGLPGLRDAALVATMSDALLRASEASALTVADIQRQADGSGLLVLAHSKTDQEGRGSTLYLGAPTMERIAAWLQAAGVSEGALFRRMRRGGDDHTVPALAHQYPEHRPRPRGRRRTPGPAQRPQPPGGERTVTHRARSHAAGGAVGRALAIPIHGGALRRRATGRARRGGQAQVRYTGRRSCPARPDHIDTYAHSPTISPCTGPGRSLPRHRRGSALEPGQDRPTLCPDDSDDRAGLPHAQHTRTVLAAHSRLGTRLAASVQGGDSRYTYYTTITWNKRMGPYAFGPYQLITEHILFGYRGLASRKGVVDIGA